MKKMVVMVVDVQRTLVEEGPYQVETFISKLQTVIATARAKGIEVVYIQHDDGIGSDLAKGDEGWQIYGAIAPIGEERAFDKTYNSAFHETTLKAYLDSKGVESLMLMGMQTEYCLDATLKSAFDLGYEVIMPEGTNTTFDNGDLKAAQIISLYNDRIWRGRFAKLVSLEEALTLL